MSVESSAPGWTYALLVLGVIIFIIVRMSTRKYAQLPAWPVCSSCVKAQWRFQLAGCGMALVGAAAFAYSFTLSRFDMPPFMLTGGIMLVIGLIVVLVTSRARIARARVTQDGLWVEVRRTSPEFAAQFAATLAAVQNAYPVQPGYWTGPVPSAAPAAVPTAAPAHATAAPAQAAASAPTAAAAPAPASSAWSLPS